LVGYFIILDWDEQKNARNTRERNMPFAYAVRVFDDPQHVTAIDDRKDYGEIRRITLGIVNNRLLSVVHTQRGGVTRIISARKANARERRTYSNVYS
jgi:uncharacterized DUF497 family protein